MALRQWENEAGSRGKLTVKRNRSPEAYLVSAVLRSEDHITPGALGVSSEFFHAHDAEWEWVETYISKHHKTPSIAAFNNRFPDFSVLKTDDVEYYCQEVRESHTRDFLNTKLQRAMDHLEDGDVAKAVATLHQSAITAGDTLAGIGDDVDIFDNWEDLYREVEERHLRASSEGLSGVSTGFPTLDYHTGGLQPGHIWLVSARLGVGKTSALIKMACSACFSGKAVQFNTLEQSRGEISTRVHTYASSKYGRETFKAMDLQRGKDFSLADYKAFLLQMRSEDKGRFHIIDNKRGAITPLILSSQIEKHKPDIAFLDYIQLMEIGDRDGPQGFARLSANMKRLAGQAKIPIVAAAQLNRKAEDSRGPAGTETLAESDAFGRDADGVIAFAEEGPGILKGKLTKHRHGKSGITFFCHFDPNRGVFEEVTHAEAKKIMAEYTDDEEVVSPRKRLRTPPRI